MVMLNVRLVHVTLISLIQSYPKKLNTSTCSITEAKQRSANALDESIRIKMEELAKLMNHVVRVQSIQAQTYTSTQCQLTWKSLRQDTISVITPNT